MLLWLALSLSLEIFVFKIRNYFLKIRLGLDYLESRPDARLDFSAKTEDRPAILYIESESRGETGKK